MNKFGFYQRYIVIHLIFLSSLILRNYSQNHINWLHSITVVCVWICLLFLLFRWDYILPIHGLNNNFHIKIGKILHFKSQLTFYSYKFFIWVLTTVGPVFLLLLAKTLNSIIVLYSVLFLYFIIYINRKVLFDSFDKYKDDPLGTRGQSFNQSGQP